jgi:hypothetical protein
MKNFVCRLKTGGTGNSFMVLRIYTAGNNAKKCNTK